MLPLQLLGFDLHFVQVSLALVFLQEQEQGLLLDLQQLIQLELLHLLNVSKRILRLASSLLMQLLSLA